MSQIDPRGPRFNAVLTSIILAVVLLTAPNPIGLALIALQTVLFAVGATRGVQHTPAAFLFANLVRPRLAPPEHLEDARPPRFAQGVGLVFAAVGLAGYATGAVTLGAIAVGFALVAALLNATTGFCLGCEIYLLTKRVTTTTTTRTTTSTTNKEEAFA